MASLCSRLVEVRTSVVEGLKLEENAHLRLFQVNAEKFNTDCSSVSDQKFYDDQFEYYGSLTLFLQNSISLETKKSSDDVTGVGAAKSLQSAISSQADRECEFFTTQNPQDDAEKERVKRICDSVQPSKAQLEEMFKVIDGKISTIASELTLLESPSFLGFQETVKVFNQLKSLPKNSLNVIYSDIDNYILLEAQKPNNGWLKGLKLLRPSEYIHSSISLYLKDTKKSYVKDIEEAFKFVQTANSLARDVPSAAPLIPTEERIARINAEMIPYLTDERTLNVTISKVSSKVPFGIGLNALTLIDEVPKETLSIGGLDGLKSLAVNLQQQELRKYQRRIHYDLVNHRNIMIYLLESAEKVIDGIAQDASASNLEKMLFLLPKVFDDDEITHKLVLKNQILLEKISATNLSPKDEELLKTWKSNAEMFSILNGSSLFSKICGITVNSIVDPVFDPVDFKYTTLASRLPSICAQPIRQPSDEEMKTFVADLKTYVRVNSAITYSISVSKAWEPAVDGVLDASNEDQLVDGEGPVFPPEGNSNAGWIAAGVIIVAAVVIGVPYHFYKKKSEQPSNSPLLYGNHRI